MTTDTPGQPPAIEGGRVARAGARWTREEEEQLVVEVRAGTDLAEIAGRHGRTRGGIKSRLVRMIPDGEDVPDSEQLAWITARLRGDPGFDWRAQLERVSDDSLAASEAARSAPRARRVTGRDVVLAVWQGYLFDSGWCAVSWYGCHARELLNDFLGNFTALCWETLQQLPGQPDVHQVGIQTRHARCRARELPWICV